MYHNCFLGARCNHRESVIKHNTDCLKRLTVLSILATACCLTGCGEDSVKNNPVPCTCSDGSACPDGDETKCGTVPCTCSDGTACPCGINDPPATTCGNGKIDSGESCDQNNLDGKSCLNWSEFVGGNLVCNSSCKFDTSGCLECIASDTSKCKA